MREDEESANFKSRTKRIAHFPFDEGFKSPGESRRVNDAYDGLMQRAFIHNYGSLASA